MDLINRVNKIESDIHGVCGEQCYTYFPTIFRQFLTSHHMVNLLGRVLRDEYGSDANLCQAVARRLDQQWKHIEDSSLLGAAFDQHSFSGMFDPTDKINALLSNAEVVEMFHKSVFDTLTRLPNRGIFTPALTQEYETVLGHTEQKNKSQGVGLLLMDLRQVKSVNDQCGHAEGDQYIAIFGEILQDIIQKSGKFTIAARIGGDEFGVLLPNSDETEVEELKAFIHDEMQGQTCKIKMSGAETFIDVPYVVAIGTAHAVQGDMRTQREFFDTADQNMYAEKANQPEIVRGGSLARFAVQLDHTANTNIDGNQITENQPQAGLGP